MIRSARTVPGLTDAKGLLFLLTALLILSSCRASSRAKEHLELGNRYVERNQIAEAEGEYQQAIRIDADFADAYYRLGLLELQQEHPTAATKSLFRAVELDPKNSSARVHLGSLLVSATRYAEAREQADA